MADFLEDKRPAKLERAFLVGVQTPEMPAGEAAELLASRCQICWSPAIASDPTLANGWHSDALDSPKRGLVHCSLCSL